jgi:hypothetical protein
MSVWFEREEEEEVYVWSCSWEVVSRSSRVGLLKLTKSSILRVNCLEFCHGYRCLFLAAK